ncbi:MAG: LytTR family transcriptional regulator [Parvularculaceae bacterium]|nr:LytTR family transcriptional regulator [Parvularculaceae bacterium]
METRVGDRDRSAELARGSHPDGDQASSSVTGGTGLGTTGDGPGTNGASPQAIDAEADRRTMIWFGVLTLVIALVALLSANTEVQRAGSGSAGKFALYELSSVVVILALMPAVAWVTSRGMPGLHPLGRVAWVQAVAFVAFSLVHIAAMVALRKLLHEPLFGVGYLFTDAPWRDVIYEMRKDGVTYFILVMFFVLGREMAAKDRALAEAKASAAPKMLTYRSGGRTVMLAASDVLWVKSAGNYAEIRGKMGRYFVRSTLKAVEEDLLEAGIDARRVHRSYVVVASAIVSAVPKGQDMLATTSDGAEVPVSRRFRMALDAS